MFARVTADGKDVIVSAENGITKTNMKCTAAQIKYIGSLLYHAGMGFNPSAKIVGYLEENEIESNEASTIIDYLKAHGIEDLDLYEDDEVVPERIKDILNK